MANYNSNYTGQDLDYSIGLALDSLAPTFSASTSYAIGDLVVYQGKIYRCKTAGAGSWSTSKWNEIDISTAFKDADTALVNGLAAVAKSGSYTDLSNKPTIPTVSVSDTGTATDEVRYITINGEEKKLAGGDVPPVQPLTPEQEAALDSGITANDVLRISNMLKTKAGNPNGSVVVTVAPSLCIDTTNQLLYFGSTVGSTTWVALGAVWK